MNFILATLLAANGMIATTYGYGERSCGEIRPQACQKGATTASGIPFDPNRPTAAIALKKASIMHPIVVMIRVEGGMCTPILFIDKKHPRYYRSSKPIDLTPGALRALGVRPHATWSGKVYICPRLRN